jgi:hypothetical protein
MHQRVSAPPGDGCAHGCGFKIVETFRLSLVQLGADDQRGFALHFSTHLLPFQTALFR